MRPGLKQGPEVWWELTVRAMPCRHVTSFFPRLAYADCLGWSLKGGLCIPSPPKKLTPQKWSMWKWKWKEEDFNFLHIFSNFIWFWFPSSLNAQVAPWAKPATWRCRSLVIWWINVSASLESWDGNASSFGVKKWPLRHLILLTHHLVQATGGQNSRQIAGGNEMITTKSVTLKLVYHGKELTNGNGNNLKPWHFLRR